ncbi:MAG: redox-regulated ATPase YchF [Bacteroidales bacterium]|nr:MAG: redox-regulated ATPase YchF [Bacteroidales bacterium]
MGLQCGIIGITNSGKTTIFNCFSSSKGETTSYAFTSSRSNMGMISVPDKRLDELVKLHPVDKIVPATVEIVDIPGLTKGASMGEGIGNKFLADIRNTDALIHVLRCFDDDNLPHIDGTVDPVRDKETIELELQIKDIESVDKKIQKLEKIAKSGDQEARKGLEVLKVYKDHLEDFQSARSVLLEEEDRKFADDLFLFTSKPVLYVCNVDELSAVRGNQYVERVRDAIKDEDTEVLVIAGALEAEIAELEEVSDREEFLADAGLEEPGVNKLIRSAYKLLDLQTFFTMNPKEIRAWTLKRGMKAPQAAGVIHSDMERGFIKAEVIKYEDFITCGSEHKCREAGKLHVEGKDYEVKDGDILYIRFNV